jgi:hypothetical protein
MKEQSVHESTDALEKQTVGRTNDQRTNKLVNK